MLELRDTDVPELRAVFEDIERGMGVKSSGDTSDPFSCLHRITQIEFQKIGWWQRHFGRCPECEVCGRRITDAAVRFQGPFVEVFGLWDVRFAACLDRERCNEREVTNDAAERVETAKTMRDALDAVAGNRLNRTVG